MTSILYRFVTSRSEKTQHFPGAGIKTEGQVRVFQRKDLCTRCSLGTEPKTKTKTCPIKVNWTPPKLPTAMSHNHISS